MKQKIKKGCDNPMEKAKEMGWGSKGKPKAKNKRGIHWRVGCASNAAIYVNAQEKNHGEGYGPSKPQGNEHERGERK